MILISRTQDQGIVIGDEIVVTVTEIRGDEVELSIEYPPGVPVDARQVFRAVNRVLETSPQP